MKDADAECIPAINQNSGVAIFVNPLRRNIFFPTQSITVYNSLEAIQMASLEKTMCLERHSNCLEGYRKVVIFPYSFSLIVLFVCVNCVRRHPRKAMDVTTQTTVCFHNFPLI